MEPLEGGGRHGGDVLPAIDGVRRHAITVTEATKKGVARVLIGEEGNGEGVELVLGGVPRVGLDEVGDLLGKGMHGVVIVPHGVRRSDGRGAEAWGHPALKCRAIPASPEEAPSGLRKALLFPFSSPEGSSFQLAVPILAPGQ